MHGQRYSPFSHIGCKTPDWERAVNGYRERGFFGIVAPADRGDALEDVIGAGLIIGMHRVLAGAGRPVAEIPVPGLEGLAGGALDMSANETV